MNSKKYKWNNWQEIDWKVVERSVFKIQKRIYKASQGGNFRAVYKLQKLLSSSFFGRLWATRKVTQDNQGKKTAGIDGIKSLNSKQRFKLADNLSINGKSKPTRRVWIPKPNGEQRPLGIPTIEERAKQCLVKLVLEPQWEAHFENNSFGFRPAHSAHDAIASIFDSIKYKPKFVLDADISKCFDKINHQKLLAKLNTYPKLRKQIKVWLKSGVIDKNWTATEEGTPQGGVVSPLLANIALHGMEQKILEIARSWKGKKGKNQSATSLIRYADDFVILHSELEKVMECKIAIEEWLKEMGLELKPSKTSISHTLKNHEGKIGFDFLGFTIRQFPVGKHHSGTWAGKRLLGYKTIIKPSKEKINIHLRKISEVIDKHKNNSQETLIRELNPIIVGWANYYKTVCSSETFGNLDHLIYLKLKRWGERRHPKKGKRWVKNRYWHTMGNNHWTFGIKEHGKVKYRLKRHSEVNITRHVKVKREKSLFDGDLIYWSTRMGRHPEMPTSKAKLLKKQKGKCNHCGLYFKSGDILEIDHIIPKSKGGKNRYDNFQLLHRHCHDIKTATDGSLENIPLDKISPKLLQDIAENLYNDKIKEGDGKL